MNFDEKYKILILGDSEVGKSEIIQQFLYSYENQSTVPIKKTTSNPVGIKFYSKTIEMDSKNILIKIIEIEGKENNKKFVKGFLRIPDCVIVIFDLNNISSYESVKFYAQAIESFQDRQVEIKKILIGNKSDLEREQGLEKDAIIQRYKQFSYYETSALERDEINKIFSSILKEVIDLKKTRKSLGYNLLKFFSKKNQDEDEKNKLNSEKNNSTQIKEDINTKNEQINQSGKIDSIPDVHEKNSKCCCKW